MHRSNAKTDKQQNDAINPIDTESTEENKNDNAEEQNKVASDDNTKDDSVSLDVIPDALPQSNDDNDTDIANNDSNNENDEIVEKQETVENIAPDSNEAVDEDVDIVIETTENADTYSDDTPVDQEASDNNHLPIDDENALLDDEENGEILSEALYDDDILSSDTPNEPNETNIIDGSELTEDDISAMEEALNSTAELTGEFDSAEIGNYNDDDILDDPFEYDEDGNPIYDTPESSAETIPMQALPDVNNIEAAEFPQTAANEYRTVFPVDIETEAENASETVKKLDERTETSESYVEGILKDKNPSLSDNISGTASQRKSDAKAKKAGRIAIIIALIFVIASIITFIVMLATLPAPSTAANGETPVVEMNATTSKHVSINIEADGLSSNDLPFLVSIDGNEDAETYYSKRVNMTIPVRPGTPTDITLNEGSYTATIVAAPMTENGSIWSIGSSQTFTLSTDGDNTSIELASDESLDGWTISSVIKNYNEYMGTDDLLGATVDPRKAAEAVCKKIDSDFKTDEDFDAELDKQKEALADQLRDEAEQKGQQNATETYKQNASKQEQGSTNVSSGGTASNTGGNTSGNVTSGSGTGNSNTGSTGNTSSGSGNSNVSSGSGSGNTSSGNSGSETTTPSTDASGEGTETPAE